LQAGREVNPLRQLVAIPLLRRQVRVVETGSDCGNNSRVSPNVKLDDARPLAYFGGRVVIPVTGLLDTPDGQYITIHSPMLFPAR
jgi:hypothetical protein